MPFEQKLNVESQRGFGLIEVLVSITIITLVSAVVIAKHTAFNGAVILRNQAYEIAFAIRQTQLLSVSGSNPNISEVQQYGIHFVRNSNSYIIFRDNNANGYYDAAIDSQIGPAEQLDKRFTISNLFCTNAAGHGNISVTFKRPNFDALFRPGGATAPVSCGGAAYIDVRRVGTTGNAVGNVRRVEVTTTGQVTVTTY